MRRKIVYSEMALSKRKKIKKEIKDLYGQERANRFSAHVSAVISNLKEYPKMGVSMRDRYDLDCDYYMLLIEQNYFIYRIWDDKIIILEIFNEREDFMYQMFGIVTTSQETEDYWGEY